MLIGEEEQGIGGNSTVYRKRMPYRAVDGGKMGLGCFSIFTSMNLPVTLTIQLQRALPLPAE